MIPRIFSTLPAMRAISSLPSAWISELTLPADRRSVASAGGYPRGPLSSQGAPRLRRLSSDAKR